MLTKACEYGIRAVMYLARETSTKPQSLKSIAKEIESPVPFTAKILQSLAKNGLVKSVHGAQGGFFIPEGKIAQMTIADIIAALDPGHSTNNCILGLKLCNENTPCPVHHYYKPIRKEINEIFEKTTINEMALSLASGQAFLKTT